MTMKPRIQIFVACHKPTYVLDNRLLVPIQVGTTSTEARYERMEYDNNGDNISAKNSQYCELTAQYWAWKNTENDYYGFFHYRRYMSFANIYPVCANGDLKGRKKGFPYIEIDDIRDDLTKFKLDADYMEKQIGQYDLITILREKIDTTAYKQFCQYHKAADLEWVLDILKRFYPQYNAAAQKYMNSKEVYYMNMYIMKKELFFRYMEWLFTILTEFEREIKKQRKEIEPRLMGFLAERLFGIFYTYQRENGAKCAELSYLRFYNTEIDRDMGSTGSVRFFKLKPSKIIIKIDMRKLNRMFPPGSRRRIFLRRIFVR